MGKPCCFREPGGTTYSVACDMTTEINRASCHEDEELLVEVERDFEVEPDEEDEFVVAISAGGVGALAAATGVRRGRFFRTRRMCILRYALETVQLGISTDRPYGCFRNLLSRDQFQWWPYSEWQARVLPFPIMMQCLIRPMPQLPQCQPRLFLILPSGIMKGDRARARRLRRQFVVRASNMPCISA